MCRWLAYTGSPILLTDVLYTPAYSLIDQSLHSRLGAETTNGDGFGVGWYDAAPVPGVFRSIEPAWNDQNLRELAGHLSSPLFFAHIRAAIGSAGEPAIRYSSPSQRPRSTRWQRSLQNGNSLLGRAGSLLTGRRQVGQITDWLPAGCRRPRARARRCARRSTTG